jgi:hypothetical protein
MGWGVGLAVLLPADSCRGLCSTLCAASALVCGFTLSVCILLTELGLWQALSAVCASCNMRCCVRMMEVLSE